MSFFLESFERTRREGADAPALWSRGEDLRLSFSQLGEWGLELSRQIGAGEGAPLGVAVGNSVAFCALFLALRHLDLAFIGIDAAMSWEQKVALCRRLGITRLVHRHADAGLESTRQLGQGLFLDHFDHEGTRVPPGTALVKLTSGSTGDPLGACFDEKGLEAGIQQIAAGMEIDARDRVLLAIPLSHSYGFDNGLLSLLALGTPLVLEPSFYPAAILRALQESEASVLPLVPPLVRGVAQLKGSPAEGDALFRRLPLRRVLCAGGTLLPETAALFAQTTGVPVHNFFGSTETGGISFERSPEDPAALGTVGHPLPGVDIELDAEGRVAVLSAANTLGHFGRDFVARQAPIVTGDLATFTPEGRLRLLGRSAEILNVGGKKISVVEIEKALLALPGVLEAAVVGVEDHVRGDRCVAFLVADAWPVETSSLPPYFAPREVHRLDHLPHTERGKLDRKLLRLWATRARQ